MVSALLANASNFVTGRALPVVLASGEGVSGSSASISDLTNSMVSGLEGVTSEILKAIGSLLPTILMLVGAVVVINFGISFFKKMGKPA